MRPYVLNTQSSSGGKARGSYHYIYESGREGDMPLIGFSPRKSATVLYNVTGFSDSEALLAKLGKHATGKSCLYIKRLADVDQRVLEALLVKSVSAMRGVIRADGSLGGAWDCAKQRARHII